MNPSANETPPLVRTAAELIALRERTDRQHKLFEQLLTQTRDELKSSFGQFTTDVQGAFNVLRDELAGERKFAMSAVHELIERAADLARLAANNPPPPWGESVAVAARAAAEGLARLGVHRFDAEIGDVYKPGVHERAGTENADGVPPGHVARQLEPGWIGQEAIGVVRRAKVMLSG